MYKTYYKILTKIRQKLRWCHLRLQSNDEFKYHNLTSTTTPIKWQWTCVCLGKQSLSVDVMPSLTSTCLFSPASLISLGCQMCPEEHDTMLRTTMNMVQGHSLLLHLSPANLHVNLPYPADRTAGPPPHSLEKNCCLLMATVLLLQKEAQTFLWEISAWGILLRAFGFAYTETYKGCQQLLLFWASFVKASVSPVMTIMARRLFNKKSAIHS